MFRILRSGNIFLIATRYSAGTIPVWQVFARVPLIGFFLFLQLQMPPGLLDFAEDFNGSSSDSNINISISESAILGEIRLAGVNGGCIGKYVYTHYLIRFR